MNHGLSHSAQVVFASLNSSTQFTGCPVSLAKLVRALTLPAVYRHVVLVSRGRGNKK